MPRIEEVSDVSSEVSVSPPDQTKADILTQIARGASSGLTAGLVKPFADAGEGGLPEELAKIVGLGVGLGFPGVGAARLPAQLVALLARTPKFAGLLKQGVTPGQAALNMIKPGYQIGKTFTPPGAAAAMGAGVLGQSWLEGEADLSRGEPPTSLGRRVFDSSLALGAGALGGALMSRGAKKVVDAAAEATEHAAVSASRAKVGMTTEEAIERAKEQLSDLENKWAERKVTAKAYEKEKREIERVINHFMQKSGLSVPPPGKVRKLGPEFEQSRALFTADRTLGKRIPDFQEQLSLFPESNPTLTQQAMGPLTREERAAGVAVGDQPSLLFGSSGGEIPSRGIKLTPYVDAPTPRILADRMPADSPLRETIQRAVGAATEPLPTTEAGLPTELLFLAQKAITTPGSETSQLLEAAQASQRISPPGFLKTAEEILREKSIAAAAPPVTIKLPSIAELKLQGIREDLWKSKNLISPGQIVGALAVPAAIAFIPKDIYGGEEELGEYGGIGLATAAILAGRGRHAPRRAGSVARAVSNIPLGPAGQQNIADLYPLKATGLSQAMRWAEQKFRGGYVAQPSMLYAGVQGLEELPLIKDMAVAQAAKIQNAFRESLSHLWILPAETKEKVREIFLHYAKGTPEAFEAKIAHDVPDALPAIQKYQEVMDRIYNEYVAEGVLRPGQRITNYFPDVKEVLSVMPSGEMRIEYGINQYIPIELHNLLRTHIPVFARSRVLDTEDAFKRIKSFDQMLEMYGAQYSRFKALRQALPDIEEKIRNVPDYLQLRVADDLNAFFGMHDPSKRVNEFWKTVASGAREYQFARTIGRNALSPIMNYFQKLNTFAVVGTQPFFQAFADMNDPARLAIARRAGLVDLLRKNDLPQELGIESRVPKWWENIRGGKWFSSVEKDNQLHAFMSGLRKAELVGIENEADQVKYAWRIMNDTQFIQTGADMAPWMRNEAWKTLGQYKGFQINQLRFMERLIEQAARGALSKDMNQFKESIGPLVRYLGPIVALSGPTGIMPGDWTDEDAAKTLFGKAAYIPGILPLLGVSLQHQLGLGAVGLEDINSFMFYLPGPSVGFLQALYGSLSGKSGGRGADTSDVGRELSVDERMRAFVSLFPGGVQANRVLQALRLVQSDGEFRRSLDWGEFIGLPESVGGGAASGDLMSEHAARTEQILAQAIGIPTIEKERERTRLNRQQKIMKEHDAAVNRAGSYVMGGKMEDARREMLKFVGRYKDDEFVGDVDPMSLLSRASLKAAQKRHELPPGKRKLAPQWARGFESFLSPPGSIFDEEVR